MRRLRQLAAAAVRTLLVPLLTPLIGLLVVRLASPELWGGFSAYALLVMLAVQLGEWGQREYLLRTFARQPSGLAAEWGGNLRARLPLLLVVGSALALLSPAEARLSAAWFIVLSAERCFAPLIAYRRAFGYAAAVEGGASLLLCTLVVSLAPHLSLGLLLGLHAAAAGGSALCHAWRYRATLRLGWRAAPAPMWRAAAPFFGLALAGWLQSRGELYLVAVLLPASEFAAYRSFSALLILGGVIANTLYLPLIAPLYRATSALQARLARRLALLGAAIAPLIALGAWLAVTWLYRLPLSPLLIPLGALAGWPIFAFLPQIYALYRAEQAQTVLQISAGAALLVLILSALLIPLVGSSGALLASAAAQWAALAAYRWRLRR